MKNRIRDKPSFSVLMAAKDAEGTIEIAVKSTLLALGRRDELLIFLDGCQDDTLKKIRRIKDDRVVVHISDETVGRSAARNFLSLQAKGDFIAILDSDDLCLPWRFFVSRLLLRKYDAVFGSAFLFGNLPLGLPIVPTYPIILSASLAPLVLTYRNPFIHSTAAFRREIVTRGHLYQDIVAEEYLLWIQMAFTHRIYRTWLPLIGYRMHPGQVSRSENFYRDGEACSILNSGRDALRHSLLKNRGLISDGSKDERSILRMEVKSKSLGIRFEEEFIIGFASILRKLMGPINRLRG